MELGTAHSRDVVDKPFTLYPGVQSLIPGSSSLSDEALSHGSISIWP